MLDSFVAWGPVGLVLAMILQAIIAPIPSEGVLTAAGLIMPLWEVVLFGGVGEVLGAAIAFYISKKIGRKGVEKLIESNILNELDKLFLKYGGPIILALRVIPFVPFDAVSYFAGLTSMPFFEFIVFTIIGAFPRALFFGFLGNSALSFGEFGAVVVIFVLVLFVYVLHKLWVYRS